MTTPRPPHAAHSTLQVAGQQGAYLAHLINSQYQLGVGGYTQPPPFQIVKRNKLQVWAGAGGTGAYVCLCVCVCGGGV